MMEPLLVKYRGKCSLSSILTNNNNRFGVLPKLDAYPTGICWLHSIAICPYGPQCASVTGHVKKGEITEPRPTKSAGL